MINSNVENKIHSYLKSILENELDCKVRIINGTTDHIHILILLNQNHSVADVFKHVKWSSSHWINQQNLFNNKFAWQLGYGDFSVGESMVKQVEKYIRNQKEHHNKITFTTEYEWFMKT